MSGLKRVRACGRNGLPDQARCVRRTEDAAYYSGVQRCGSVWACAVCSAKIRQRRAEDITAAVVEHIKQGGEVWMVTLTARHHKGDRLAALIKSLPLAYGKLTSGGAWCGESDSAYEKRLDRWVLGPRGQRIGRPRPVQRIGERAACGVRGWIRSVEVTYGENGWHPHLHVLVLLNKIPEGEAEARTIALARMQARWGSVWRRDLAKHGFEPDDRHGIKWEKCERVQDAAEYVAKTQDGGWPVGMELARGDLKDGKLGRSLTPMRILDYARITDDETALPIWREYEDATRGMKAIQWSQGLRAELVDGDDEGQTDEEIAEEEVGGEVVAEFSGETWKVIAAVDGLEAAVLRAVEAAGFAGLVELLTPYGVAPLRPTPKQE